MDLKQELGAKRKKAQHSPSSSKTEMGLCPWAQAPTNILLQQKIEMLVPHVTTEKSRETGPEIKKRQAIQNILVSD
jgi:hypothetical protein